MVVVAVSALLSSYAPSWVSRSLASLLRPPCLSLPPLSAACVLLASQGTVLLCPPSRPVCLYRFYLNVLASASSIPVTNQYRPAPRYLYTCIPYHQCLHPTCIPYHQCLHPCRFVSHDGLDLDWFMRVPFSASVCHAILHCLLRPSMCHCLHPVCRLVRIMAPVHLPVPHVMLPLVPQCYDLQ